MSGVIWQQLPDRVLDADFVQSRLLGEAGAGPHRRSSAAAPLSNSSGRSPVGLAEGQLAQRVGVDDPEDFVTLGYEDHRDAGMLMKSAASGGSTARSPSLAMRLTHTPCGDRILSCHEASGDRTANE